MLFVGNTADRCDCFSLRGVICMFGLNLLYLCTRVGQHIVKLIYSDPESPKTMNWSRMSRSPHSRTEPKHWSQTGPWLIWPSNTVSLLQNLAAGRCFWSCKNRKSNMERWQSRPAVGLYSVLAEISESSWMNNAPHHIFKHREHVYKAVFNLSQRLVEFKITNVHIAQFGGAMCTFLVSLWYYLLVAMCTCNRYIKSV